MKHKKQIKIYTGNILSKKEKKEKLKDLSRLILENRIDNEMVPFINEFNKYKFLSVQCCSGHNEKLTKKYKARNGIYLHGRPAHISFRSMLSVEKTINKIIRPFENKFGSMIDISTELCTLSYCLWLNNNIWKKQMKYLVVLAETNQ